MMMLPLLIGGVCIAASVVGTFFVRLGKRDKNIMGALYKGLVVSGVISAALIALVHRTACSALRRHRHGSRRHDDLGAA